jgi:hypothetical protein
VEDEEPEPEQETASSTNHEALINPPIQIPSYGARKGWKPRLPDQLSDNLIDSFSEKKHNQTCTDHSEQKIHILASAMVVPIPSVISPSIHWKWGARNM